jgi:hypothetical protein
MAQKPWEKRQAAGQKPWEKRAVEAEPSIWDTLGDYATSAGVGINKGAVQLAALPKTLTDLSASGLEYTGAITPETAQAVRDTLPSMKYDNLLKTWESVAGELPKPDTPGKRLVSNVAEFVPGLGGAGLVKGVATGVGAGLGSEALGMVTEGSAAEPYARVVGAVLGHRAASPKAIGKNTVAREVGNVDKARKQVTKAADRKWADVRAQGAVYDPKVIKQMSRDVRRTRPEFYDKGFAPVTASITKRLETVKPTAEALEVPKRMLGSASSRAAPVGGADADLKAVRELNKIFKTTLEKAPVTTKTGMSSGAFKELQGSAREMSQRRILDNIFRDFDRGASGYLGGTESALRNRAGAYLRANEGAIDPSVAKAVEDIVGRESLMDNVVYMLGNRIGGAAAGVGGFSQQGILGALTGLLASHGARKVGEHTAKTAAQKARAVALAGRPGQKRIKELDKAWARRRQLDALRAGGQARTEEEPLY